LQYAYKDTGDSISITVAHGRQQRDSHQSKKEKKKKEKLIHPKPADQRRWGQGSNDHIYS
jgi:hypothetical protein